MNEGRPIRKEKLLPLTLLAKDIKGVSHTLQIVGGVALVAGILITAIPQARTSITNVWANVINNTTVLYNNTANANVNTISNIPVNTSTTTTNNTSTSISNIPTGSYNPGNSVPISNISTGSYKPGNPVSIDPIETGGTPQ